MPSGRDRPTAPVLLAAAAILLLSAHASAAAQDQVLRFRNLTVEDGLPNSIVFAIHQDRKGFLWFGTLDGLARYDGYRFTIYQNASDDPTSLSSNAVVFLFEDSKGRLWVGTPAGGLNLYDRDNDSFIRYTASPSSGVVLENDRIRVIAEGKDGDLWLGTTDGILLFDQDRKLTERFIPDELTAPAHRGVFALHFDRQGNLWVGFLGGGLAMFDPKQRAFTLYRHEEGDPASLTDDVVHSVFEDGTGNLWVGTAGGVLHLLDRRRGSFRKFYPDPARQADTLIIRALSEDEAGNILLGTRHGLYVFNPVTQHFAHYSHNPDDPGTLVHNSILAFFEDAKGDYWIGTRGGVSHLNMDAQDFTHYRSSTHDRRCLNSAVVYSIFEDTRRDLWFGTEEGGLNRLDRKTGTFTYHLFDRANPHSISSNNVKRIVEDRLGHLWIATFFGGLNRFDPDTQRFTRFRHTPGVPDSLSQDNVTNLLVDKDGDLWVTTETGGLDLLNRDSGGFRHILRELGATQLGFLWTVTQDRRGKIWLGFDQSRVGCYDKRTGAFTTYRINPEGSGDYAVRVIFEDAKENLWAGTVGSGLILMTKAGAVVRTYTKKDGLPSDIVYGILQDGEGSLWLSTSNGLAEFHPATGEFKPYTKANGLQGNQFNYNAYLRARDGQMYFGGTNGVTAFYPWKVHKNRYVPPIAITGFRVRNQDVRVGDGLDILKRNITETREISLSPGQSDFSFEFAALSFASSDQNKYAYMLKGFEKDWHYVGASNRTASYTNLNPGTYTFSVKGSNSDGVWNPAAVSIRVRIWPPFWKTTWFRVGIGAGILLFLVSAYRLRTYQLRASERQLQRKVDDRTRELQAENGERRRAEEELTRLSSRYQAMLASIPDIIVEVDVGKTYRWVNNAGKAFFGDDVVGKMADAYFEGEQDTLQVVKPIFDGDEEIVYVESWQRRRDGQRRLLAWWCRVLKDPSGTVTGALSSARDITERRLLEDHLRQMQKLEGLGTLAGGIAHDFNNILGIILAYTSRLDRYKNDSAKLKTVADTIMSAVERGAALVRQILTFARKAETEFQTVSVNDVIVEILAMIFETFPKTISYARNLDETVHPISADRSQLHQALLNLCINARDAMPGGGVLTIGTRMVSASSLRARHPEAIASSYVCIDVRDTGEGMSDEVRSRVFEPFFTTKEQGKGTGLGLAVVFGVVQTHRGVIEVESELGRGTAFRLYLPATPAVRPMSSEDRDALEGIAGGSETLLVVEDEAALMASLQTVLAEKGYSVVTAGDGMAAVNVFRERKGAIALVLTDLGLPKLTGLDECVQVKAIDPKARIIVATGFLDPNIKAALQRVGVRHFLHKPYDFTEVVKLVREVLDA